MSSEINILPLLTSSDLAIQDQDTTWAQMEEIPVQEPEGFERAMLSEDKLFVVLAVVLIIWFGIVWMIFRTDRRLKKLEEEMAASDA
jgi:CcmD family protein